MKKLFYFLLILCCGAWFTACGDDDDKQVGGTFDVVSSTIDFYAVGGEGFIKLNSENVEIKAKSNKESWCVVTDVSNAEILFKVLENEELASRSATIQITGGEVSREVSITQLGNTIPTAEEREVTFDYEGGNKVMNVTHTLSFTATVAPGAAWLKVIASTDDVTLTAEENTTDRKRTAIVTLKSKGGLESTIAVTQTGIPEPEQGENGSYESFLGNWKLTGMGSDNTGAPTQTTFNLTITEDKAGESYFIAGWGASSVAKAPQFAIPARYDSKTHSMDVYAYNNLGTADIGGTTYTVLWAGSYIDPADGEEYLDPSIYPVYNISFKEDGSVLINLHRLEFNDGTSAELLGGQYFLKPPTGNSYSNYYTDSYLDKKTMVMTKATENRVAYRTDPVDSNTTFVKAVASQKAVKAKLMR
jgi:hypothetical protein